MLVTAIIEVAGERGRVRANRRSRINTSSAPMSITAYFLCTLSRQNWIAESSHVTVTLWIWHLRRESEISKNVSQKTQEKLEALNSELLAPRWWAHACCPLSPSGTWKAAVPRAPEGEEVLGERTVACLCHSLVGLWERVVGEPIGERGASERWAGAEIFWKMDEGLLTPPPPSGDCGLALDSSRRISGTISEAAAVSLGGVSSSSSSSSLTFSLCAVSWKSAELAFSVREREDRSLFPASPAH